VLEALSKPTANALFVMPEAVARTPASAQISSAVGSGPFIFVKEEWRPGSQAVYVRNPDYVPRKEKPDGLAGGKVVKVDRVEWLSMPDPTTAISALGAGEIDYLQNPAMDTWPVLKANPKFRFVTVDPTGSMQNASLGWSNFQGESLPGLIQAVLDIDAAQSAAGGDFVSS